MNVFFIFDASVPDLRCRICRHHKYLIMSEHVGGFAVLHSHADLVAAVDQNAWPYVALGQGIHWWGAGQAAMNPPVCLRSYKKIGGK